ncbi:TPA: hypothetical protein KFP15_004458 [Escherichia coli]|nr:hypothetical protein [Escherichia coli]
MKTLTDNKHYAKFVQGVLAAAILAAPALAGAAAYTSVNGTEATTEARVTLEQDQKATVEWIGVGSLRASAVKEQTKLGDLRFGGNAPGIVGVYADNMEGNNIKFTRVSDGHRLGAAYAVQGHGMTQSGLVNTIDGHKGLVAEISQDLTTGGYFTHKIYAWGNGAGIEPGEYVANFTATYVIE